MRSCSLLSASQLLQAKPLHEPLPRCTHSIVSTSSRLGLTCWPSTSRSSPCLQAGIKSYAGYGVIPRLEHGTQIRTYSSKRWVDRQSRDEFSRAAKVAGLKSRAAFKLLQINDRHRLFKPGMTIVDLGFAPGSWSQVAVDLTKPSGRVLGVDLIPSEPPKGVNTIQGDFLSYDIQTEIKNFLSDPDRGRLRRSSILPPVQDEQGRTALADELIQGTASKSYLEFEREETAGDDEASEHDDKCVDVVLSDMCEPWPLLDGLWKKSKVNPYIRLMNTSGNPFRDHAGSMDLCRAALQFSYETLKIGGHFVCKFYQGAEDKALEMSLKAMFHKVHREKPDSSRSQSREAYFVGIRRLAKVDRWRIFDE